MTFTPETLDLKLKTYFQNDLGITEGWNSARWLLENSFCTSVEDMTKILPPSPTVGQFPVYRVSESGGFGEWAGRPGQIAIWEGDRWVFIVPWAGFRWIDKSHNSSNPTLMYVQISPVLIASTANPTGSPGTKKSWTIA